jgi:hypothetical protein
MVFSYTITPLRKKNFANSAFPGLIGSKRELPRHERMALSSSALTLAGCAPKSLRRCQCRAELGGPDRDAAGRSTLAVWRPANRSRRDHD